jgi:hypothetical protein
MEPPRSLDEHIITALQKVPGLTDRQKNAVRAAMHGMVRDISFLRMVANELHPTDEGRAL